MTVIAIDGPAGAGKSTVARRAAEELGFSFLDTGAMYRAVALAVLRAGVDPAEREDVARVAGSAHVSIEGERVRLGAEDVSRAIRGADVDRVVSVISAYPEVRSAMVEAQRTAARRGDVVIEGRDIGSVVVPDADVKVFLTAALEERAARRWQQEAAGRDTSRSIEEVERDIARRDAGDMSRADSPLIKAEDAVVVDTTGRTIDDVVREIVALAERRS